MKHVSFYRFYHQVFIQTPKKCSCNPFLAWIQHLTLKRNSAVTCPWAAFCLLKFGWQTLLSDYSLPYQVPEAFLVDFMPHVASEVKIQWIQVGWLLRPDTLETNLWRKLLLKSDLLEIIFCGESALFWAGGSFFGEIRLSIVGRVTPMPNFIFSFLLVAVSDFVITISSTAKISCSSRLVAKKSLLFSNKATWGRKSTKKPSGTWYGSE